MQELSPKTLYFGIAGSFVVLFLAAMFADPDMGFRFFNQDSEHTLGSPNSQVDRTGPFAGSNQNNFTYANYDPHVRFSSRKEWYEKNSVTNDCACC